MYVAVINVPGYLPESEPVAFGTAQEAWAFLAEEAQRDDDAAWVADDPSDPDGPASLHPSILAMEAHARAGLSVTTFEAFGGCHYSVDYAEDAQ